MTERMKAIREVFGVPDVFTIKPSTFGEINPVEEARKDAQELELKELP